MLLKSFMKVNTSVVTKFLVWTETDFNNPEGECLGDFTLDYCETGDKWRKAHLYYETLLELGAKVKFVSVWNKDALCVIVTVKNEFDYNNILDRKLAANGYRDYTYIK